MFTKHVSELTYSDIEDLVNTRQEREGYHLDFKAEIGNPDKAKKELAKDISAFANTSGGFLIIGVDKYYKIIGVDKTIQNKAIDEWLNQILCSNIEPQVFYHDPKIIPIPDSEKILLVIHIPESTKKPHIVNETFTYNIRINDSSRPANHNQIRDMFEFSKNRTDEFNYFLRKRNLFDENSPDFGKNINSLKLYSEVPSETGIPKPQVLFSLIPKYPNEERIKKTVSEFKTWLDNNSRGYYPQISTSLFLMGHDYDINLDGILIKRTENNYLNSYFEILNNGYVEAGLSKSLTILDQKKQVKMSLTLLVGYEMLILGFAKKLFELVKYYDEVLLQVSFINVLNMKLFGFNKKYRDNTFLDFYNISNRAHKNFKLCHSFNPHTLNNKDILDIAKQHSEKICRAFGLEHDYCFDGDDLNTEEFYHFHL